MHFKKLVNLWNKLKVANYVTLFFFAANERYSLWRKKMSRDQGSPWIILCTPIKMQRILTI